MALSKMVPYKNGTPCEKMPKGYPICQGLSWVIFKRKFLNLLYDSGSWSWDFKVEFFPLQNDIPGTLRCLMVVGVRSISRMLVVLQKTNNVVVRCQLCWVPFLGAINVRWLWPFWPSASVRYFRLRYLTSHVL